MAAETEFAEEQHIVHGEPIERPVSAQEEVESPALHHTHSEPMPDAATVDPNQPAWPDSTAEPYAGEADVETYESHPAAAASPMQQSPWRRLPEADIYEDHPAVAASPTQQSPWRRLPEPEFWGPARSGPLDVSQHAIGAPRTPDSPVSLQSTLARSRHRVKLSYMANNVTFAAMPILRYRGFYSD
jgi:hypothetical protein